MSRGKELRNLIRREGMTIAPGAYDCYQELEYLILNHPQKGFVLAFHFPIFGGAPRPAAASSGPGLAIRKRAECE
jgi:hypothetical protein